MQKFDVVLTYQQTVVIPAVDANTPEEAEGIAQSLLEDAAGDSDYQLGTPEILDSEVLPSEE